MVGRRKIRLKMSLTNLIEFKKEDCYDASGLDLYDYIEIDADDLPDDIQSELESLNVEYSDSGDDYDIYTAAIKLDDREYLIAFCPRTVALQINTDDLGNLDWDHQAFYVRDL